MSLSHHHQPFTTTPRSVPPHPPNCDFATSDESESRYQSGPHYLGRDQVPSNYHDSHEDKNNSPLHRSTSTDVDTTQQDHQPDLSSKHHGELPPPRKKQEGKADNSQSRFKESRLGQRGEGSYHEFGSNSSIQSESSAYVQGKNITMIQSEKSTESVCDQHIATSRDLSSNTSREEWHSMNRSEDTLSSQLLTSGITIYNSKIYGGTQKDAVHNLLLDPSPETRGVRDDANIKLDTEEDAEIKHSFEEGAKFKHNFEEGSKINHNFEEGAKNKHSFGESVKIKHNIEEGAKFKHSFEEGAKIKLNYEQQLDEEELQMDETSDVSSQKSEESTVHQKTVYRIDHEKYRGHEKYRDHEKYRGHEKHRGQEEHIRRGRGFCGKQTFKQNDREEFRSLAELSLHDDMTQDSSFEEIKSVTPSATDSLTSISRGTVTPMTDSLPGVTTEKRKPVSKKHTCARKENPGGETTQTNSKSQSESKETAASFRTLRAGFHIFTSFKDKDDLKEAVQQLVDISKMISFQFVDDSIICNKKHGRFTMVIQTGTKQLGINLIKDLYKKLRESLKTDVTFRITDVDKEKVQKESSPKAVSSNRNSQQKADKIPEDDARNYQGKIQEGTKKKSDEKKTLKNKLASAGDTSTIKETTSDKRHDAAADLVKGADSKLAKSSSKADPPYKNRRQKTGKIPEADQRNLQQTFKEEAKKKSNGNKTSKVRSTTCENTSKIKGTISGSRHDVTRDEKAETKLAESSSKAPVFPCRSKEQNSKKISEAERNFPGTIQEERKKQVHGNKTSQAKSECTEHANNEVPSGNKHNVTKETDKITQIKLARKINTEKKHKMPAKIPTEISVIVNKVFPDKQNGSELFLKIIRSKALNCEILPDSVATGTSNTVCKLMAPSKNAATKVVKQLKSYKQEGLHFSCHLVTTGTAKETDYNSKAQRMQAEREKVAEEIRKKAQEVLEAHQKMIKKCEKDVGDTEPVTDSKLNKMGDEKLALRDKLTEVCNQRDEFSTRKHALIEKVKKLSPLSTTIIKDLQDLLLSFGVECKRLRAGLSVYARREEIVKTVSENQVSVILGETGSGKSTQMAQYIYEAGLAGQGMIVCTQPRKVAAITLAERVAEEMVGKTGNLVGYKTGMQKKLSSKTKIIFTTDYSLLNDSLADQSLSRYTCIIVDEAHERSIYTDLLLGMIKACLPKRPDLKVIITSATIDPEIFIKYFKCRPELRVSGRTFPVEVIYSGVDKSQEEFDNFESRAVQKAIEVHKNEEPGDILVFLTSPVEIMRCCEEFQKCVATKDFQCFPLHGQLPPDEQRKVFKHLPQGIRKVIFATNCAETSITIDGIKYVIDAGVAKEKRYDSKRNICSLGTFVISRSSADQRKGRAGRTSSGKCFRLYSEEGYKSMSSSNEPEILKVPLAQSVLKLSELGVDIKNYDFVQPPSEDAIDLAVKNLKELGALSPEGITDIGRWISKLPLEPKEGFLIFKGKENNLLYDSIVVAALVTNGSNLFYRGLTESEAQKSAKIKSQYSSPHGDIFTWLEVYKDWVQQPKEEQSKWCTKNGINYKVMNYTRQFVEEVITVLNNELKTKLARKFSSEESAVYTLQKILFYANLPTVCHYLGHVRAGYHALMADRQVHLHPSSSFLSQNSHPEWIIYTELTKTSRDFIKGITVVSEDWIQEVVSNGKLQVDINVAKQWKTELVHRETVGLSVFHKMVGTRYARLQEWEDELTDAGMKAVVVEADRDLGILDIYSCSAMNETVINHIASERNETIEALKSDEVEIEILKKIEKEPTGIRVTLGQGGCVKSLLMPYQSNKILITKSNYNTTEEIVRRKFEEFGNIKECVRFKRRDPWGFIRYDSCAEAQSAVDSTSHDEENVAVLKLERQFKKPVNEFQAKLSWCRRPVLGAFITCPPIEKAELIGKSIYFPHGVSEIKMSRRGVDLIIFNIGNAGEEEIERKVMDILNYNDNSEQNIYVTLLRERVKLPSWKEMNNMKDTILNKFTDYIDKEKFRLEMKEVKMNSLNYIAFIYFDNPVDGFRACRELQHQLWIEDQIVEIIPKLKTTLHVSKSIMKVCKTRLEEIITGLSKYDNTEAWVRPLRQGDFAIDINSGSVEHIVEARELMQKMVEGEVIDCSLNAILKNLLKQQAKYVLRKLEVEFEVLITVDSRREQVHIYGSVSSVNKVQSEINNYLEKLATGKQVDVSLKGQNKPPGLMKELMLKYGSSCDGLIQEFALTDVTVDFRRQNLSIFGPPDNVDKAVSSISELESSLLQKGVQRTEKWMPECVVCMSPVEGSSELYRLEACGHSYCLTCLKLQIGVSMTDKNFPVVCAQDGCEESLVWKDFAFCLDKQWITEKELVEKSANSFVSNNVDKYRFCLTPECPVFYKVTENEEGYKFACPSCFVNLCSSCHTPYHEGLTCKMSFNEPEAEKKLEEWKMQDPENRKICPGCKAIVEKESGCNKMRCQWCRASFCWVCLKVFESGQKCYAHLVKEHGGFR